MNFSNGLPLRSATFRESVRLPGSSQTAFYITSDDYPLAYYPELNIIRCTLRKGMTGIQGHGNARCYHVSVMKDMDLVDDPADLAAAAGAGLLVVASASNLRANPVTGVFERVVEEVASAPAAAPTPAETPKAKRPYVRRAKATSAPDGGGA